MRVISFSCGGEGTAYASATGERGGEARTRRRGWLGVANVALCAALVGGLGGCGAPPSEPAEQDLSAASAAIRSCPVGSSWQCTREGLHGSLLCGCEPDAPPPPPTCAAGSLTCVGHGPESYHTMNVGETYGWQDPCISNNPSAFSETVDWGDGTSSAAPGGAVGCPGYGCPGTTTIYNNFFQHLYKATKTYQVKVTVRENVFNQSCTLTMPLTISP